MDPIQQVIEFSKTEQTEVSTNNLKHEDKKCHFRSYFAPFLSAILQCGIQSKKT
jgi:hypothetical protein